MPADVLAGRRVAYDAEGGNEAQKVWRFHLRNWPRLFVGSRAWPIAFSSWPVLPILDRQLLETAAGIPAASLGDRRAEAELVASRFPALAALRLDRNSFDFSPLRPRLRYQLRRAVVDTLGRVPGAHVCARARRRAQALRPPHGRERSDMARGAARGRALPGARGRVLPAGRPRRSPAGARRRRSSSQPGHRDLRDEAADRRAALAARPPSVTCLAHDASISARCP